MMSKINYSMRKCALAILVFLLFFSGYLIWGQTAKGAGVISSVANFNSEFSAAADNEVLMLNGGFLTDLSSSATGGASASLASGDPRNIILDGGGQIYTPNAGFSGTLFSIVHNGNGTLTIRNMTLKGLSNIGFNLSGSGTVNFENVSFENNAASSIYNTITGSLNIDRCNFIGNRAQCIADGANYAAGHVVTINESYFSQNKAGFGVALSLGSGSQIRITHSTFSENTGAGNGYAGGAICADQKGNFDLQIDRSYFYGNVINGNVGGAIALYRVSNATGKITNSVFEANKSLGNTNICDGGAIAVKNNGAGLRALLEISGCNFIENYAYDNGGAILLEASNGGITTTTLYNCTFAYNHGMASAASVLGYGGAVQLYDTTNTQFFFNTFYKNFSGNGWYGGAIGVNMGFPEITNNIFIDSKTKMSNKYQNIYFRGSSENVAMNNGNIGYDNGKDFVPDDAARNAEVVSANIFKDFYQGGDAIPAYAAVGDAKPVVFDRPVGASGYTADRICYIITPLTDEMFRTNSRTVDTGVYEDVRGFPREKIIPGSQTFPYYPNAGAVEIYWTKFDPGAGDWNSAFDISGVLGAIKTLISGSNAYYIVTDPPVMSGGMPQYSSAYAFPRDTLQGPANQGFLYWEDDKTLEQKDVDERYESRKQTYIAQWRAGQFHVDFQLAGGTSNTLSHFDTQIIINGVNNNLASLPLSDPVFAGHEFEGWYADRHYGGVPWDFAVDQVFADVTLYAKWENAGGLLTPPPTLFPTPLPSTSFDPYPPATPYPSDPGGSILNPYPSEEIIVLPPFAIFPYETAMPIYTPSVTFTEVPELEIKDDIVDEETEEVPVTGGGKLYVAVVMVAALAGAMAVTCVRRKKKHSK